MTSDIQNLMRNLPGVDRVLSKVQTMPDFDWPLELLTVEIQHQISALRKQLLAGTISAVPAVDDIALSVLSKMRSAERPSLRPVINASGILLHTNLGRAPLAEEALARINQIAGGYSNLEMDLETGRRGSRHSHVEELLCRLTGAEAAMVVNNNAGAVLLALTAIAKGREAIVSRGELVEIGGSFRIPEVMEAGGVLLREVGSSNRTHLRDYQRAINDQTALLLKVHTSNYRIVGFTSSISASELVSLSRESGIPLLEDLGSGLLRPVPGASLPDEPTIAEAVASGVDLLTCSGDKLLGGPQAGLIFGRKDLIERLRSHPLARALRTDKLSLAALEGTLHLYLSGAEHKIPLMSFFAATPLDLQRRSQALQQQLEKMGWQVELIDGTARVGGGAMPEAEIPGPVLAVQAMILTLPQLAAALRKAEPALIGRVHEDRMLLNLRTVKPEEDSIIIELFKSLQGNSNGCAEP